jgi:DNA polymerase elongation subunit (family B)
MYNSLIYGKDATERLVSLEVHDGNVELFIQQLDGSVKSEFKPYKYWLLSDKNIDGRFTKLGGNQTFKYIVEIEQRQNFYNTIKYCERQNANLQISWNFKDQFLLRSGMTYFKGLSPKDITILSFDIETSGLIKNENSCVYLITNTLRKAGKIERRLFNLEDYENQWDMMLDWSDWVRSVDPTLIAGHNIMMYDLPYMHHCMGLNPDNEDTLPLGRDGSALSFKQRPSKIRKDGSQSYEYNDAKIFGREIIDTMFLSLKYDIGRKYESYGLKSIIKHEGLEKTGRTFVDASKIREYYENRQKDPEMWSKVVQYAIEDSDDALKLFDLMVPALFYQTQSIPMCFQNMVGKATGSQLNNYMMRAYLQDGHSIPKATDVQNYEGAISFGIPGMYKNCFKVDVSSLYPSIMREYKVCDPVKDPKGYFLETVEYFTLERLKNKKLAKETKEQYYKDMEQAQKTTINSMYGFLGASGLNFNYIEGAAFITRKGREILAKSIEFATSKSAEYWIDKSKGLDTEEIEENDNET